MQAVPAPQTASAPGSSPWTPLSVPAYRSLWLGALAANIGLWVQNAASSWDMTSLSTDPLDVALLQTASSVPVLLVGLPAAALGDIYDRRKLLVAFASFMALASVVLSALSLVGALSPTALLALTFALGLGAALSAPLWQAILPSLVDKRELASAVTLSGVAINIARAVGPALGGVGLGLFGSGPVYAFNALAFGLVVLQVVRWQATPATSSLPPERVAGAVVAGLRYGRESRALRGVLMRAAAFIVCGSALWALLPVVARRELHMSPLRFGLLLGCVGVGALAGAWWLPRLRARYSPDALVASASAVYAAAMLVLGLVRVEPVLYLGMGATGVAWIAIMSSLNVAAASAAPGWVLSRALGLYLLVFQGGLGLGSLGWGALAGRLGAATTLSVAAAGVLLGLCAGLRWQLGAARKGDVASFNAYPEPVVREPLDIDVGPVLVERRYRVAASQRADFLLLADRLESLRRRDGAMEWALYQDVADPELLVETFVVSSWGEHLRQHKRAVAADAELLHTIGLAAASDVVHLVDVRSAEAARRRGVVVTHAEHPEES